MKRAQAALEFLSTYGFAFLIILVMIGALMYFGVLTPANFLPERCVLGTEFECRDYVIDRVDDTQTDVSLIIANNIGNTVRLAGVSMNSSFGGASQAAGDCTVSPSSIAGGETARIDCTINSEFPAEDEKVKLEARFQYVELGGNFNHTITGEVYANIQ